LKFSGDVDDHPETGYGYIKRGAPLGEAVFAVDRFVEKPDEETAVRLVAGGDHDWNGGIFLFQAKALLRALEEHAAAILEAVKALDSARREGGAGDRTAPPAPAGRGCSAKGLGWSRSASRV